MNVLMQAEHGASSATYDFTERFVIANDDGTIVKTVLFGRIKSLFGWIEATAYYGHSYQAQDKLLNDFEDGKISIPIIKKEV